MRVSKGLHLEDVNGGEVFLDTPGFTEAVASWLVGSYCVIKLLLWYLVTSY